MRSSKRNHETFYVIGISLDRAPQRVIAEAFPFAIFYNDTSENRGITPWLCKQLGRVLIFQFMPRMASHMDVHVSAVFSKELVKVVGIDPSPTVKTYDRASSLGYAGVLHEAMDAQTVCRAAEAVHRGELWFPRDYMSQRILAFSSTSGQLALSEREEELLALLAEEASNQEIADQLCVSRDTVRWHLRSIYAKLGVSNRDAAFQLACNRSSSRTSM